MKHEKSYLSVKKAIGHLNKVLCMIEEEKYCIDVLQQMNASIGHLKSAQSNMLETHFNSCAVNALAGGNEQNKEKVIAELVKIFKQK